MKVKKQQSGEQAAAVAESVSTQLQGSASASGNHMSATIVTVTLEIKHLGERIDKVLAHLLPDISRGRIQQWITDGKVTVDGKPVTLRQAVYGDEEVRLEMEPDSPQLAYTPEPVPLEVVAEDDTLIVINKPAGLVVHPGAGNWSGTVLNGLLYRWPALAQVPRAGIVHRLDKETSGLMVIAKTSAAQFNLVRQLQARTVRRLYLALVWGNTRPDGVIDAAIARHPRERTKMAVSRSARAKMAVTRYLTLGAGQLDGKAVSLVRCQLQTGRTHQIRVHMQSLGHPLVGDQVYGKTHLANVFPRQALHAVRLGLIHPAEDDVVAWQTDLPEDLTQLVLQSGIDLEAVLARLSSLAEMSDAEIRKQADDGDGMDDDLDDDFDDDYDD